MSVETGDIQKLKEFLDDLECYIGLFVDEEPFPHSFKNKDDNRKINLMRNAWKETRPRFEKLREYLSSEKAFKKLEEVGLTASSLDFKLSLVEESMRRIDKVRELGSKEEISDKSHKRFRFSGLRNPWRKYFEYADIIIGSMGAVGIPGADAIGEFKRVLEKILKWQNKR